MLCVSPKSLIQLLKGTGRWHITTTLSSDTKQTINCSLLNQLFTLPLNPHHGSLFWVTLYHLTHKDRIECYLQIFLEITSYLCHSSVHKAIICKTGLDLVWHCSSWWTCAAFLWITGRNSVGCLWSPKAYLAEVTALGCLLYIIINAERIKILI